MKVGIIGLGLIGGSAAKAYKRAGDSVYAYDINDTILDFAKMTGVVDGTLDATSIGDCELILIALYPAATVECMKKLAPHVRCDAVMIDLCGIKRELCNVGFELAREYGYTYVGGHPMAGTQYSGFSNSRDNMFYGAGMVIVPPVYDDMELLERIKSLLSPLGFGKISVTTAEKHDELIAFTSQMPHIVSNAFIKSPTSREHLGFSAGSYRDLTRVAWLNAEMWTELFLENRDNLVHELDTFIEMLGQYKTALESNDSETLKALLEEGSRIKSEVDG